MIIFQSLIDSIVNLLLFSLIPFIWWFIFWRKKEGFLFWIGIKKPIVQNKRLVILLGFLFLVISLSSNIFIEIVETSETAVGQFQGMGIAALPSALLFGMIKTGAAEEILFRGFLAKRCIQRLGFVFGNIIQAFLFGVMHLVLFQIASSINLFQSVLIFSIPFLTSLFFGYINEKKSDGSIIPSWLMHGIGNVIASIITMFNLNI
jgi:membrane protease YdiL (CAAX protease family)